MDYMTSEIVKAIRGTVICEAENMETEYPDVTMIPENLLKEMVVTFVEARDSKVVLHFVKDTVIKNDLNADWVKEYIEKTGVEPSFF